MSDYRADRPTPSPQAPPRRESRVLLGVVAICGLTVGLLGPRILDEGRTAFTDVFPSPESHPSPQAAPAIASAAPTHFPRDIVAVRVSLDAATSPVAKSELIDRLGILGDGSDVSRLETLADSLAPQVRISALNALARLDDDHALDVLFSYVASPDWEIAGPALGALGRSDADRALDALHTYAADPDLSRRQTAWAALALRGGPRARTILHRAAATCASDEAWSVMYAVAGLGAPVDQRFLLSIAQSSNSRKASSALSALSSFPAAAITDALIELAQTGPQHRRGEALNVLAALKDPRVVPVLESAARGPRKDRNVAIYALGRSPAPGAFEALVGIAADALAGEVEAATSALAGRGEQEARVILREMAVAPEPLGPAALVALSLVNDEQATALMVAAFDERGVLPPAQALNHLALHGGEEGWSLLEEVLATGDLPTRNSVVWALQQRGDADAADRLMDLARTGDQNVAAAALGSLEQMGDEARDDLRSLLMERVKDGTDADFGQSVQTLARLGGEEVLSLLTTRLDEGTMAEKQQALGALAQMGDADSEAAMRRVYDSSEDPAMRVQVLNHLLWSENVDDSLLDSAMADDDPTVVASVAYALAQRGGEDSAARLLQMAEADDVQVRTAAISSLAQVGGEEAEAVLLAGLADPEVAPSIMWPVSLSSSPLVREALRDVARNGDPELRASALSSLSMDPDPETNDLLESALRDEDNSVAQSALYALQSRGSSSAAGAIAAVLDDLPEDEDYGLRYQAANALRSIGGPDARSREELLASILDDQGDLSLGSPTHGLGHYGIGQMVYPIE